MDISYIQEVYKRAYLQGWLVGYVDACHDSPAAQEEVLEAARTVGELL